MKKQIGILAVGAVIAGMTLNLVGVTIAFQPLPSDHSEKINKQKAVPFAKIKIAKKVAVPMTKKGRPESKSKPLKVLKVRGAATGVLGHPLSVGANKYAIVIGISNYSDDDYDIGGIGYTDVDATKIKNALDTLYGYDKENIFLLQDENATYNEILSAVNNLKNSEEIGLKEGDEVVFYFSGHGGWLLNEKKEPIDEYPYDETDGKDEMIICHDMAGISDDMLVSWFSDFPTSRIVFFFDSCLAGGMNDVSSEGVITAMATAEETSAYAFVDHIAKTTQGHFSYYFVEKGMLEGFADKYDHNDDGVIARGRNPEDGTDVVVEEAFDYAKKKCPWQTPVINDLFTDDLLLGYNL